MDEDFSKFKIVFLGYKYAFHMTLLFYGSNLRKQFFLIILKKYSDYIKNLLLEIKFVDMMIILRQFKHGFNPILFGPK